MWQSAYRGLIDQAFLDGLTPEARARRYTFGQPGIRMPVTLVAVRDATISGFVTFGLCRDEDSTGEVMAIYVDPSQLGTGVGRLLIEAARERLRGLGVSGAVLWVLEANTLARRFYERDGWAPDGARRTAVYGDGPVVEVRYRRTPV
ncbi:GNAT family N-acetyltransferase [Mycobacterium kiyosense]|uniref:N-acetyltransferase n=1 Tax=Mycobacterium kiyosense TaxID=2871094 RepID=A0A9P3Q027_9MYCO|nr:GNAT family N-acetyltransferase [Mycobacterium kiyosense]BDB42541.1 N-acetyltransferase [Mycobacterium kiyosense]GLB81587.1 N-acetyltransferase [Mycobacterium kiyosense]GLB89129.1 N-acetyltransferase [Mycobacterium kiyosense]GLB93780.1 N-acetyltransferase [Mycobacterium kiyosense]GLC00080.1 N-acetyltransferase [Mycobacterium kiyosense]